MLTPGEGALAGAGASAVMLLGVWLLHAVSGPSPVALLTRVGHTVILRATPAQSGSVLAAGAAVYAVIGALLGILYAVSQDRAPARAVVGVGVFYGLVIWVGGRVITSWLFGPEFRTVLHSYAWLLSCLLYGGALAGCALWVDRRRPREARAAPID